MVTQDSSELKAGCDYSILFESMSLLKCVTGLSKSDLNHFCLKITDIKPANRYFEGRDSG